jgi:DNA repair protein RadC
MWDNALGLVNMCTISYVLFIQKEFKCRCLAREHLPYPRRRGSSHVTQLYPACEPRRRRRRLTTLRLVREGSFSSQHDQECPALAVRFPEDVFILMRPYADREVCESFWILPLDSQHCLSGGLPIVITRGILNSSVIHPREVFASAIMASAAAVILCHNHPSGDPTPSVDDRIVTEQLVASGKLLDIPVHDHVIIGRGRYVSFAEQGFLR